MPRNDDDERGRNSTDTVERNSTDATRRNDGGRSGLSIGRRSYLMAAGATVGSIGLASGRAAAASFERWGIRFKRTVDMVADAGCDPTGEEPCDAKIRAAADDYTLLKFPPGEYQITSKTVVLGKTNLGFLGEGDARFRVPTNFNEKALVVDDGTGLLFEGIDIDQRADGATPALHLGADDDLRVHDVELLGQGIHPKSIPKGEPGYSPGPGAENGNPHALDFFYPIVRSADGTGLVTDVVANNHGLMGTYNAGNGRSGIWVGISTEGTITFRNCRIEEFGSNGTYTSRTNGVVQFEDGVHRNNDNNQLRIGSPGSYAKGMILDVDAESSGSPNPYGALNYRGVRIEMGRMNDRTDVTVRDCDIAIRSTPHSGGGVVAESTASEFRVENTRIGIEADGVRGILAKEPDGGGAYPAPAEPHTATIRNTSVTGSANGNAAIELRERSGSVVANCCIEADGGDRDGVAFVRSNGCVVRNSTIDTDDQPVVERNAEVDVSRVSAGGSCPVPSVPESPEPSNPGDSPDFSDGAPDDTFTIEAAPGTEYEFGVTDELKKTAAANATVDPNDTIEGTTASGQVGEGGRDSYAFAGEITRLVLDGGANLYYNGESVDPAKYLANTVTIESESHAEYEIETSDGIAKSAAMGAADPNDTVEGTTASGQVGEGGRDSFAYPGEIANLAIDGDATVYRNGDEVEPDEFGLVDTFTIEAAPETEYELAASESLEKTTRANATIDPNDEIEGTTASGQVGEGGRDSYAITGEITRLVLDGGANLYYNGESVDPAKYLANTVTIESDSRVEYTIETSDGIAKSAAMGAADPNDTVSGRSVSGQVGAGGRDSFAYPGEITNLTTDGNATVYRNGERIDPDELGSTDTFTIEAAPETEYEFGVDGELKKTAAANATVDPNDTIEGTTASGQVGEGGRDSYAFAGEITRLVLDGGANLYYNGESVDPAKYLANTVTIESESHAEYEIETSDGIAKSAAMGAADPNDTVEETTASGQVGEGGRDSFAYPGEITSLAIDGDATVYRNGEVLADPGGTFSKQTDLPVFGRLSG
ncbi:right-handed parallel beta-helix repeat-containing protein [Halococcus agarilyticus]|uniref:right-handed parallel beta-helix repeat-containing protein n=1 Tax=Halococcus agarilyticus TaxID=1232219 RepID=UPI000A51EFC5|nr:right-handed parallel beta-helix repeat-containing protein [Halococcus agarilyticus]